MKLAWVSFQLLFLVNLYLYVLRTGHHLKFLGTLFFRARHGRSTPKRSSRIGEKSPKESLLNKHFMKLWVLWGLKNPNQWSPRLTPWSCHPWKNQRGTTKLSIEWWRANPQRLDLKFLDISIWFLSIRPPPKYDNKGRCFGYTYRKGCSQKWFTHLHTFNPRDPSQPKSFIKFPQ